MCSKDYKHRYNGITQVALESIDVISLVSTRPFSCSLFYVVRPKWWANCRESAKFHKTFTVHRISAVAIPLQNPSTHFHAGPQQNMKKKKLYHIKRKIFF